MSQKNQQGIPKRSRSRSGDEDSQEARNDNNGNKREERRDKHSRSRSRERKPDQKTKQPNKKISDKESGKPKPSTQISVPVDAQITDELLQSVLGFSGFSTSKNKDHSASSVQCVQKSSQVKRKYRQYMNRWGGFNRNLDQMN